MDRKAFTTLGLGLHAQVYKVGEQQWVVKRKYRQRASKIQAMKDHNESVCRGQGDSMALMATLPMTDALTLKAQGINVFNPNDDEMAYIMKWMRLNRPHLIGEKYRVKRQAEQRAQLIKEVCGNG